MPRTRFLKRDPATLSSMAERRTKWEEDNASPVNVWAIFATAVLILFVAGLAVLFALT
jgi:hypothetical protein